MIDTSDNCPKGIDHIWFVYSTCLSPSALMVQCCLCSKFGHVRDYTPNEWTRAYYAPSQPYLLKGGNDRVEEKPIPMKTKQKKEKKIEQPGVPSIKIISGDWKRDLSEPEFTELCLPDLMVGRIQALVDTGLYGSSMADACERIIAERLRKPDDAY
jgi:hypothetical protein